MGFAGIDFHLFFTYFVGVFRTTRFKELDTGELFTWSQKYTCMCDIFFEHHGILVEAGS